MSRMQNFLRGNGVLPTWPVYLHAGPGLLLVRCSTALHLRQRQTVEPAATAIAK